MQFHSYDSSHWVFNLRRLAYEDMNMKNFRRGWNEFFRLLGYYAWWGGETDVSGLPIGSIFKRLAVQE
jgi:hypothetical protein